MVMIISPRYKVLEVLSRIKDQTASKLRKNILGHPRYAGKRILSAR